MIPLSLFMPLVAGGLLSAMVRERRRQQQSPVVFAPDTKAPALPAHQSESSGEVNHVIVIDDVAEVSHQQRVSLIALALSGSGSLVYAPITLMSIPLLSYGTYYFLKTLKRSSKKRKKSAMTVFEVVSVAGSLLTGRYLMLASLLAFSFSTRKWTLQAGNLSYVGMNKALDPSFRRIWVLRGDVEIEINLSELQANDVAMLQTGDIIRKNGEIVSGEGIVKQFSLTGIIQAIPKEVGDNVFAFTEVAAGELSIRYL